MEVKERVGRADFKAMHIGETKIFKLVTPKKCTSARVTAAQLGREEGLKYKVSIDYTVACVSITRLK